MLVFVSAAEISSDIYASKILKSLKEQHDLLFPDQEFRVFGIGGPNLRQLSFFECIYPAEKLRSMGFGEVLKNFRNISAGFLRAKAQILKRKPDLTLTFDYPDFHFRLMKKVENLECMKVCMIPPKVWVWRKKRIHEIRRLFDAVGLIFPFEQPLYETAGIPASFCGNPLVESLPLHLSREQAKMELGLQGEDVFNLAFFPGSRGSEVFHHVPLMSEVAKKFSDKIGKKVQVSVPIPHGISREQLGKLPQDSEQVRFRFFEGKAHTVLRACDYGVIKSGTSVLESVVLGCHPVVIYKVNWLTEFIVRNLVRYKGPVSLPNILLGFKDRSESFYLELLGIEVSPDSIVQGLMDAIGKNAQHLKYQTELLKKFGVDGPERSEIRFAKQILDWFATYQKNKRVPDRKIWKKCVSLVWSFLNFVNRRLHSRPTLDSKVKVIQVGNLQAGGAGKTPIVGAIAQIATRSGFKVAVLSRGYGRRSSKDAVCAVGDVADFANFGDELCELRKRIPELVLVASSKREKFLKTSALQELDCDLILLDDGFQNPKLNAHYKILCVTDQARDEVVYRDFFAEAQHADLILKTKARLPSIEWNLDAAPLKNKKVAAILGVADPMAVLRSWESNGINVVDQFVVPDHSEFQSEKLNDWIGNQGSKGIVVCTTAKDSIRLEQIGIFTKSVNELPNSVSDRDQVYVVDLELGEECRSKLATIVDKIMKS